MKMLFDLPQLEVTEIDCALFNKKKVKLFVARLDKLHEIVSGNKLFKLHFFVRDALLSDDKSIITFGGAYSNHLLATAYACNVHGLKSTGIVRAEQATTLSHTLNACRNYGMKLKFVSRETYARRDDPDFQIEIKQAYGPGLLIPEGGYHPTGAKGAALILNYLQGLQSTHICTAVGTATTLAGLLQSATTEKIIGIPVLKNLVDINDRLRFLNNQLTYNGPVLFDDFHFGGYAKKTAALLTFMNKLYDAYRLPTDFVYTAKMMFAVIEKIKAGYFAEGSIVTCLHTGGLQGNDSLPAGTLVF